MKVSSHSRGDALTPEVSEVRRAKRWSAKSAAEVSQDLERRRGAHVRCTDFVGRHSSVLASPSIRTESTRLRPRYGPERSGRRRCHWQSKNHGY